MLNTVIVVQATVCSIACTYILLSGAVFHELWLSWSLPHFMRNKVDFMHTKQISLERRLGLVTCVTLHHNSTYSTDRYILIVLRTTTVRI